MDKIKGYQFITGETARNRHLVEVEVTEYDINVGDYGSLSGLIRKNYLGKEYLLERDSLGTIIAAYQILISPPDESGYHVRVVGLKTLSWLDEFFGLGDLRDQEREIRNMRTRFLRARF